MTQDSDFGLEMCRHGDIQEAFSMPGHIRICEALSYWYEESSTPPPPDMLEQALLRVELTPAEVSDALEELREPFNADGDEARFIIEEANDFLLRSVLDKGAATALRHMERGDTGLALMAMREAVDSTFATFDMGLDYFDDLERLEGEPQQLLTIPTGVERIDLAMTGGLKEGELGVVLGRTSLGKTWFLIEMGLVALQHGFSVAHYTLELSQMNVAKRYDMAFASDLLGEGVRLVDVAGKLKEVRGEVRGKLIIKDYATDRATVADLRSHVMGMKRRGVPIDLVVVDYADLLHSTSRWDDMRHVLHQTYQDLRGLGGELGVPVWTASQTNRPAFSKQRPTLEDFGEAYSKAQVADVVVSLCQTEKEKDAGIMRLFLAKNRDGKDAIEAEIQTAFDKGRMNAGRVRDVEFV